jgi:hypothetical protein
LNLLENLEKEVEEIVEEFFGLFRPKKKHKTERIEIVFHKENKQKMAAPTVTGTTNNGNPLFATIQPVQASGADSNGVVSNLAVTLSDTTIVTATIKTSASGVQYVEFDTLAVGTITATFTCTVTDPGVTAAPLTFTQTATITVTAGASPVLTAAINILFSSTVPA